MEIFPLGFNSKSSVSIIKVFVKSTQQSTPILLDEHDGTPEDRMELIHSSHRVSAVIFHQFRPSHIEGLALTRDNVSVPSARIPRDGNLAIILYFTQAHAGVPTSCLQGRRNNLLD